MNQSYDVIIVGGGASGMIAAVKAAERGLNVFLTEKNQMLGRKVFATGNGRCNILNRHLHQYYGDSCFADSVFKYCNTDTLISFFKYYGLMLTEEDDGRMYPNTFHSSSVVSAMKKALAIHNVDISLQTRIVQIKKEKSIFTVISSEGYQVTSPKVIISCGGSAQPKLGGTTDGYDLLKSLGHSIVPVFPSLVPVITDQKSVSGLSGIRVHCTVTVLDSSQIIYRTSGEVLFTEYGISGICIMQCSRFVHQRNAIIEIDFIHNLFSDNSLFKAELKRRQAVFKDYSPVSLLEGIIIDRLSYAVLKQAGIPLRGEKASDLSNEDLDRIIDKACHYRIHVIADRGIDFAQVSAGGASCSQFSPSTMESNIVPGLYATGEVLNVDGDCGGYNLMFAFATGFIAGESC